MWRTILAVVLLPSIVWAQEQSLPVPEKQETVATKDPQPIYKALVDPRTIRPGKTEIAVAVLFLGPGLVVSRNESSSDLVPLKMDFEESDGLTATSLSFSNEQLRKFAFHDEAMRNGELLEPPGERDRLTIRDTRVRVLDGSLLRVNFKLKASKNAPLGEHLLRAKVTVQSISDLAVLPPQQIEVQLPVTVVDHDTKPKTARSDAGGTPILIWILAPLLIPLIVVMAIVCGIRGQDCSC
jgi:hypothetical protein